MIRVKSWSWLLNSSFGDKRRTENHCQQRRHINWREDLITQEDAWLVTSPPRGDYVEYRPRFLQILKPAARVRWPREDANLPHIKEGGLARTFISGLEGCWWWWRARTTMTCHVLAPSPAVVVGDERSIGSPGPRGARGRSVVGLPRCRAGAGRHHMLPVYLPVTGRGLKGVKFHGDPSTVP